jgi:hypothetical protein
MAAVPVTIPVTTPEEEPTVAIEILPLVHVPPDVLLLSDVVDPEQTVSVPVIGSNAAPTVTTVVTAHPVAVIA